MVLTTRPTGGMVLVIDHSFKTKMACAKSVHKTRYGNSTEKNEMCQTFILLRGFPNAATTTQPSLNWDCCCDKISFLDFE